MRNRTVGWAFLPVLFGAQLRRGWRGVPRISHSGGKARFERRLRMTFLHALIAWLRSIVLASFCEVYFYVVAGAERQADRNFAGFFFDVIERTLVDGFHTVDLLVAGAEGESDVCLGN